MAISKKRKTSSFKWSAERWARFNAKKAAKNFQPPLAGLGAMPEKPEGGQYSEDPHFQEMLEREKQNEGYSAIFNRPDMVNHPPHYNTHPSGIECIDIVEWLGFNIGSAVKYLWRAPYKMPSQLEDYRKAIWYIQREIERLEKSWSKGRREIHGPR